MLVRVFTSRAQSCALPDHQMISVGLIFVSQTQHPNVYHRGGVSGGQGGRCSLSVLWGRVAEFFCMLIRKITNEEFIGCATSAPYGSSPRVSVRVIDSSRDFNSAVVQLQVRRTHIFRMLGSMLPMGVSPESIVESQTRRRTRRKIVLCYSFLFI